MVRLKEFYKNEVVPKMVRDGLFCNPMQVPRLVKVTLNMGVGGAVKDKKVLENALHELSIIAGQKAISTRARKSNASFKIRSGWLIGCKVTLRSDVMYGFLDRLIMIVLPRVRDFRGLSSKSFDGTGNYNIGIKEHSVFPEIERLKVTSVRGLDISITTTAKTDKECALLLHTFKLPITQSRGKEFMAVIT